MDPHALVSTFDWRSWTCTLWRGLSSCSDGIPNVRVVLEWGDSLPRFGVAPWLGLLNSHYLAWAARIGVMDPHVTPTRGSPSAQL